LDKSEERKVSSVCLPLPYDHAGPHTLILERSRHQERELNDDTLCDRLLKIVMRQVCVTTIGQKVKEHQIGHHDIDDR
jgi:hypothetical protein